MTHSEDLKYAQDIFKMIKWYYLGIAERNPLINSGYHVNEEGKSFFYQVSKMDSPRIFSYSTKKTDLQMSYCTGKRVVIFLNDSPFYHIDFDDGCTSIPLYTDIHSEAEYFQNSLLYEPVVNRDLLTISYLKSRHNELYDITHLEYHTETLSEMMATCRHALTFPKHKDLVGE